jgi:hypothetical protein
MLIYYCSQSLACRAIPAQMGADGMHRTAAVAALSTSGGCLNTKHQAAGRTRILRVEQQGDETVRAGEIAALREH